MEITLTKEQRLVLGQHMYLSMKLLQMSAQELDVYLSELSLENPLISAEPPKESRELPMYWAPNGFRAGVRTTAAEDAEFLHSVNNYESLADCVREQIAGLRVPELMQRELDYLAGELDERGYLPPDCGDLMAFCGSEERYRNAVTVFQAMEPAGVGARSLEECLCIQLRRRGYEDRIPFEICEKYLDRLAKGQLNRIAGELGVTLQRVYEAKELIASLEPRPSNGYSDGGEVPYVIPDVEVLRSADGFEVVTADKYMPVYGVDAYYARMSESAELSDDEREYFRSKLQQAKWAVNCVARRRNTLFSCAKAIVDVQREFFEDGTSPIAPLTMTELSYRLGISPSTVSRAVKDKYLSCKWGVYPMSRFFAQEICGVEGATCHDVLSGIKKLIASEDSKHPLSDREIAEKLSSRGLPVSRRTVAKYREEALIPSAPGRRVR